MDIKYAIAGILLLSVGFTARGQGSRIVDDTTRLPYGARTTKWISESDIFFSRTNRYQPVDTSVRNYHNWTYVQRFRNFYKDLGNVGTALYPIFPQLPRSIGVSTGFECYKPYFETQDPVYFNTQSPYTRMQLIWAGKGRAMSDIRFSRNIDRRWNFGFSFRPILIDKQIQRLRKGDRHAISYYYDAQMSYKTKNGRYRVLFNYRRMRHMVNENGGVIPAPSDEEDSYAALFDPENQPKLTTVQTEELHNRFHLFQQYALLVNRLQAYYQTDIDEEINVFQDTDINSAPPDFYDNFNPLDEQKASVRDYTKFLYWTNKVGVKGRLGRWGKFFYDSYFKTRTYLFNYKHIRRDTLALPLWSTEYYFGGHVAYNFDSLTDITGWADLLLEDHYNIGVRVNSKWVDAKVTHISAKPPFIYNAYRGTLDFWNNRFKDRRYLQAEFFPKLHMAKKRIFLSTGLIFTQIQNYIYFRQDTLPESQQTVLPVQSDGKQTLLSPEVRISFKFLRHINLQSQVIYSYTLENDDDALRIPTLFVNTRLSYKNTFFKGNLQLHTGVDMHWKPDYRDLGYDPVIQQFYVQDDVVSPSFFLVDIFFNVKIRKGRAFLKYHNLVQAITQSGYLSTPGYPAQRNILDFGFEFLLFD